MLIVLLIIFITLTIVLFVNYEEEWAFISAIGIVVTLGFICSNINTLLKLQTADEMIAMYEEENARIESQIDTAVRGYMQFESETFAELALGDAMVLVSLYPELKSDALVISQLSMYQSNNQEIRELKEKKINAGRSRWWLYFGNPRTTE